MFDIAGVLREAANPSICEDMRNDILKCVEGELDRLPGPINLELDSSAPIIHYIFARHPTQRPSILSLCLAFEAASIESITEHFHFDYLLCFFLEYRSTQESSDSKENDRREPIILAFRYIKLLLSLRKSLPISVVRSLVSLCESASGTDNEKYIPSFIGYLCEACLYTDVSRVPEVCSVLVEDVVNRGSPGVVKLLSYAIEMGLPLIRSRNMLWPLMAPLSKPASLKVKCALESLLQTWPGLMYFGIQGGAILHLIRCLPKQTDVVIEILKKLLRLEGPAAAITDPFNGVLLDTLLKCGLIECLNRIVAKPAASQFLNEILPYTGTCLSIQSQVLAKRADVNSCVSNSMWSNLSLAAKNGQQTMTVASIEKMVQLDYTKWDWAALLMLFTIVLPHNEQEASGSQAKEVYSKLLGFFGGTFLTLKPGVCVSMIEPLYAMIDFLLTKLKSGPGILKANTTFVTGLKSVIEGLAKNGETEFNSPKWILFKCVGMILTSKDDLLIEMKPGGKSIFESLAELCQGCTSEKVCAAFLDVINFDSFSEMCVPLVQYFLISKTASVHETAINELRKKRGTSKNSIRVIIEQILLRHMESISDDSKMIDRLLLDVNFLAEMISTDDCALKLVVEGKAAQRFDTIMRKHSHFVLAIVMSQEIMLERPWINEEIQWWVEHGNREYVRLYDRAIEYTFARTLGVGITKEPSIVNHDGTTTVPPHLFGKLAQTPKGVKLLCQYIPQLLNVLSSEQDFDEIRAALFALGHFGSSPYASTTVEHHKIPEIMIDTIECLDSYVLKGTLLAALSLFKPSKYLASVLRARHWQLFRFGSHFAVIPEDSAKWLGPLPQIPTATPQLPDIPKYKSAITNLRKLSNSLVSSSALDALRLMKTSHDPTLNEPDLALFAHNLLSQYHYEHSPRHAIFSLFASVPVMTWKDPQTWQDTLNTAEISARVHLMTIALKQRKTSDHSSFPSIPKYPVETIRAMRPPPRCPESFLSDANLESLCGCTRSEFYKKSIEDQHKLRERIIH